MEMQQERRENKLRFDKSISIGNLLTAGVIIAGIFGWGQTVETRIAVHAAQVQEVKTTVAQNKIDLKEDLDEIKQALKVIDNRLFEEHRADRARREARESNGRSR